MEHDDLWVVEQRHQGCWKISLEEGTDLSNIFLQRDSLQFSRVNNSSCWPLDAAWKCVSNDVLCQSALGLWDLGKNVEGGHQ